MIYLNHSHRRYNPLTKDWVIVSPQRSKRPWQGKIEEKSPTRQIEYDSECYLCANNKRINGEINPDYKETFVFPNDFPALSSFNSDEDLSDNLFKSTAANGECKVVCFSPKHNATISSLSVIHISRVIQTWKEQVAQLTKKYSWVQIFENKGEIMGCSNPHPHAQIWASNFIPNELSKENLSQKEYFNQNDTVLLLDYAHKEISKTERVVYENDNWLVVVPFWALWPFETMLIPKKHLPTILDFDKKQIDQLADCYKKITSLYDRLFNSPFPYTMGLHFSPSRQTDSYWQFHMHFYPPLLRSSTIKKFMVGYEMLAEGQRDITPEQAAKQLKNLIK